MKDPPARAFNSKFSFVFKENIPLSRVNGVSADSVLLTLGTGCQGHIGWLTDMVVS